MRFRRDPVRVPTLGRLTVLLLATVLLAPEVAKAQVRQIYSVNVDSLSGSPAALRTSSHRLLLDAGFSVREVAACDCILTTDTRIIGGEPVELRLHILRPPNGIIVRVVIQALVGTGASTEARSTQAASAELRELLDRLRDGVRRARLPR